MTLPIVSKSYTDDELWILTADILTELSKRHEVEYRVKASGESVVKKLNTLEGVECDV